MNVRGYIIYFFLALGATLPLVYLVRSVARRLDLVAKLVAKNLDFIVANDVSRTDAGMESDANAVTVLDRRGGRREVPLAPKREVAEAILDQVFGETPA